MVMIGISIVGLVAASLYVIRILDNPTEMDVFFCITNVLWTLYEAGDNEASHPAFTTWIRRLGLTVSGIYLTWIATYYIN